MATPTPRSETSPETTETQSLSTESPRPTSSSSKRSIRDSSKDQAPANEDDSATKALESLIKEPDSARRTHSRLSSKGSVRGKRREGSSSDLSAPPSASDGSRSHRGKRNLQLSLSKAGSLPTASPRLPLTPSTFTPLTPSNSQPSLPTPIPLDRFQIIEYNFVSMKDEELFELLANLEKSITSLEEEQKKLQLLFKQEDHQTEQLKALLAVTQGHATGNLAVAGLAAFQPQPTTASTPRQTKPVKRDKDSVRLVDVMSLKRSSNSPLLNKNQRTPRENCILEFLTSEQTYVTNLRVLVTAYFHPLTEHVKAHSKFPEESIPLIFGNIFLIYQMSDDDKCLCKLLEERLAHWDEKEDIIGDVIEKWCTPQLKGPYATYVSNYDESARQLTNLLSSNSHFKKLFTEIDDHVFQSHKLRFSDLHICPVQRFPRYCLLVRDLLKVTPQDHPDFQQLTAASKFLEKTASHINEKRAANESTIGTTQVISRFERLAREPAETYTPLEIDSQGTIKQKKHKKSTTRKDRKRAFIKSGLLASMVDLNDPKKTVKKRDCELLLFNDILVATPFYGKKNLVHEFYQPTACLWIDRNPTADAFIKFEHSEEFIKNLSLSVVVRGPLRTWFLVFKTVADKKVWTEELCKVCHLPSDTPFKGFRNGVFDYPHGRYDGNWYAGFPNGEGVFKNTAGETFNGHWHHSLRCGYGKFTDFKGVVHYCGWKDLGESILPFVDFWENINNISESGFLLDNEDWKTIFTNAEQIKYKKDAVVVEKGKVQTKLMRCKAGSLRIEVRKGVFSSIPSPYVLGDSSFISEIKVANRFVWANEDCEFEEVTTQQLVSLFQAKHRLAMRFYRDKARKLAIQLRQFNADLVDEEDEDPSKTVVVDKKTLDAARFNLPETELLSEMVPNVVMKEKIEYEGKLFILTTVLVFEYTVFGLDSQKVIHLDQAKSIKFQSKKDQIKIDKFKFLIRKDAKRVNDLIHSLWEDTRKKRKTIQTPDLNAVPEVEDITLNERDKQLMLAGAKQRVYAKGDVIVKEGDYSHKLYQVQSGTVIVSKNTGFSTTLGPGVLFGEISFLETDDNAKASASVTADSEVMVYLIEGWYINALFVDHPAFAAKFYSYLCSTLAKRLVEREKQAKEDKKKKLLEKK